MERKELNEPLLGGNQFRKGQTSRLFLPSWLHTALVLLSLSNLALLYSVFQNNQTTSPHSSKFAGLLWNTTVQYDDWTAFQEPTMSTDMWKNFDLSPVEVMLSDAEAEEYGLKISPVRFPWDQRKGIYYVKVFHDLHCLKVLRAALAHPAADFQHHAAHCLDALRQDLMCYADDTLMPLDEYPTTVGDGQHMQCRDFSALVRWTQEPERFPCYSRPVDEKLNVTKPEDRLEAYAFCKEGSPYYPVQEAYFARWGHRDHRDGGSAKESAA